METTEIIKDIFVRNLGVERDEIHNDTTNRDLKIDSLDKVEIVMDIEHHFKIAIPDEKMDSLKCFLDYVNIVEGLK